VSVPTMDRQLALMLEHPPRLGAEDFLVGPANAAAHALVVGWPAWTGTAALVTGPEGSGKTHLATIWSVLAGAPLIEGAALTNAVLEQLEPGGAVAVDGAQRADDTVLFHLVNLAQERRIHLLLTAREGPSPLWPRIADLASRLRAMQHARLGPPDEATLRAVLVKLFDDRQLVVEASVVEYLARRLDRSIGVARLVVEALDREALARGRRVTRGLAAQILERHGNVEP
jgi:chromosomal replication initiation ATPase DnaA